MNDHDAVYGLVLARYALRRAKENDPVTSKAAENIALLARVFDVRPTLTAFEVGFDADFRWPGEQWATASEAVRQSECDNAVRRLFDAVADLSVTELEMYCPFEALSAHDAVVALALQRYAVYSMLYGSRVTQRAASKVIALAAEMGLSPILDVTRLGFRLDGAYVPPLGRDVERAAEGVLDEDTREQLAQLMERVGTRPIPELENLEVRGG